MKRTSLPTRVLCLLDDNRHDLEDVQVALAHWPERPPVKAFRDPAELEAFLHAEAGEGRFEPCGMVLDTIGITPRGRSPVDLLRRLFPRARAVLYSNSTSAERAAQDRAEGRIDDFQSKGDLAALRAKVADQLRAYRDPALEGYRDYLLGHPEDWGLPVLQNDRGEWLTGLGLYWEMVRGTPLGEQWLRAWQGTEQAAPPPADEALWAEWQQTWPHLRPPDVAPGTTEP